MLVLAEGEGRNDAWANATVLGSAGKVGESGAGGCPVLQESVCMGEAESVSGSLLQGAGVFGSIKHSNNYVLI